MRAIIQRVSRASVKVGGETTGSIGEGLLILLGIREDDDVAQMSWLIKKISFLVVSQFTLYAGTNKGNRPSFIRAAKPDIAIPLYEQFVKELGSLSGLEVKTGVFGADMKVELNNDGPVTILIDSHLRE